MVGQVGHPRITLIYQADSAAQGWTSARTPGPSVPDFRLQPGIFLENGPHLTQREEAKSTGTVRRLPNPMHYESPFLSFR